MCTGLSASELRRAPSEHARHRSLVREAVNMLRTAHGAALAALSCDALLALYCADAILEAAADVRVLPSPLLQAPIALASIPLDAQLLILVDASGIDGEARAHLSAPHAHLRHRLCTRTPSSSQSSARLCANHARACPVSRGVPQPAVTVPSVRARVRDGVHVH